MQALAIVVSFDVGEQVVPGGVSGRVVSLMHEPVFRLPKQLSIGALLSACHSTKLRSAEPLARFAQQFPFRLMDWTIPAVPSTLR